MCSTLADKDSDIDISLIHTVHGYCRTLDLDSIPSETISVMLLFYAKPMKMKFTDNYRHGTTDICPVKGDWSYLQEKVGPKLATSAQEVAWLECGDLKITAAEWDSYCWDEEKDVIYVKLGRWSWSVPDSGLCQSYCDYDQRLLMTAFCRKKAYCDVMDGKVRVIFDHEFTPPPVGTGFTSLPQGPRHSAIDAYNPQTYNVSFATEVN